MDGSVTTSISTLTVAWASTFQDQALEHRAGAEFGELSDAVREHVLHDVGPADGSRRWAMRFALMAAGSV